MGAFEQKDSRVHGKGLFTVRPLPEGKVLFETHKRTEGAFEWLNLVPNCSYNHSLEPNCQSLTIGEFKYLMTIRDIAGGEELLVAYRQDEDLEQPADGWM